MEEIKNKGGRPTDYNEELALKICEALASSAIGLRKLCDSRDDFPDVATVRKWVVRHEWFGDQYMKALANRAMWLAEEIEEIADDSKKDTYIDDNGNKKVDSEVVARSRLRVDTRKWIASKLLPKIYGDKNQDSKEVQTTLMQKLIDKL